ncbi:hypothetical protein THRCLA_23378 [Thraustotheca clavata]|uniref:EXPERA domain-containing protein n=1 Tax=Thraustotheca clavata TaxID=74557 RepID=A0A1V9Y6U4_9STRA|nr:hypothetical protein THRCLA_23378 [Thraustotheca clavata]
MRSLGFDWFFVAYCAMSLTIALICDAEALLHDPKTYGKVEPIVNWPPEVVVRALHKWGDDFDPLLNARPLWFKSCFYLEMAFQVPYYIVAIYAFINEFATPAPVVILASYLPFAIGPALFLYRARGLTMFDKIKQA